MAKTGHKGHPRLILCPLPNLLVQAHGLRLTSSTAGFPESYRKSPSLPALLPCNTLSLASPRHLYVSSLLYYFFVLCNSLIDFLSYYSLPWLSSWRNCIPARGLGRGGTELWRFQAPTGAASSGWESCFSVAFLVMAMSTCGFSASGSHQLRTNPTYSITSWARPTLPAPSGSRHLGLPEALSAALSTTTMKPAMCPSICFLPAPLGPPCSVCSSAGLNSYPG